MQKKLLHKLFHVKLQVPTSKKDTFSLTAVYCPFNYELGNIDVLNNKGHRQKDSSTLAFDFLPDLAQYCGF